MKKLSRREKVLVGVSVISVGVAGYFGYKYVNTDKINDDLAQALKTVTQDNNELKEMVKTLMEAASEGVFEEAIGTVNNKINHRSDKKKYLLEALEINPNDGDLKQTLTKVNIELKNLFTRKDKFTKAQALYEIKNEI